MATIAGWGLVSRPPGSRRRASRRLDRPPAAGPPRGRAVAARALRTAQRRFAGASASSPAPATWSAPRREMADVDYEHPLRAGRHAAATDRARSATAPTSDSAPGRAEVAFAVADEMQGQGLGTILLAHLAEVAEEHGIAGLPRRGPAAEPPHDRGVPRERLPGRDLLGAGRDPHRVPDLVRAARRSSASRSATASPPRRRCAASCEPRAVAVIGASRRRGTVGGEVFHNLLESRLRRRRLSGQPGERRRPVGARLPSASPTCPSEVDLAVIAVPAAGGRRGGARMRGEGVPGARRPLRRLRRDRRGGRRARSASWSRSAARPGCAWSAPTASA